MNTELPVLLILHLVEKKCGCVGSVGVFYSFWYIYSNNSHIEYISNFKIGNLRITWPIFVSKWFQIRISLKKFAMYDIGGQMMAKAHMAFGQVS